VLDDVRLILDYRGAHLPKKSERARKLDIVASNAIITGLITYGWKWDEILSPRAPKLIKLIDLHLQKHGSSLRQIKDDGTVDRALSASGSDSQCAKRNCTHAGDTGNTASAHPCSQAERPVNQVPDAGNSVPGAPVPGQWMPADLSVDPQIDEGLRGAGRLDQWMPADLRVDPQIDEGLRGAGRLGDWMPADLRVDPQIDEGLRGAGRLGDWMPADLRVDPQIDEGLRGAGSLDNWMMANPESLQNMSQFCPQGPSFSQQTLMTLNGAENLQVMPGLTQYPQVSRPVTGSLQPWAGTSETWNSNEGQRIDQTVVG
jgi:hypothetical protein